MLDTPSVALGQAYRRWSAELLPFAAFVVGRDDAPRVVLDVCVSALFASNWESVKDHRAYLYRAVTKRGSRARAAVYLCRHDEMSADEAASLLGVPERTVRFDLSDFDGPAVFDDDVPAALKFPDGALVPRIPSPRRKPMLIGVAAAVALATLVLYGIVPFYRHIHSLAYEERNVRVLVNDEAASFSEVNLHDGTTDVFVLPANQQRYDILEMRYVAGFLLLRTSNGFQTQRVGEHSVHLLGDAHYALVSSAQRSVWLVKAPALYGGTLPGVRKNSIQEFSLAGAKKTGAIAFPASDEPVAAVAGDLVMLSKSETMYLWDPVSNENLRRFGRNDSFIASRGSTLVVAHDCRRLGRGDLPGAFSPNGCKTLDAIDVRSGEHRVYRLPADEQAAGWVGFGRLSADAGHLALMVVRPHPTDLGGNGHIDMDESMRIARLVVLDLRSGKVTDIPQSEATQSGVFAWSLDGRWLFYGDRTDSLAAIRPGGRKPTTFQNVDCCRDREPVVIPKAS